MSQSRLEQTINRAAFYEKSDDELIKEIIQELHPDFRFTKRKHTRGVKSDDVGLSISFYGFQDARLLEKKLQRLFQEINCSLSVILASSRKTVIVKPLPYINKDKLWTLWEIVNIDPVTKVNMNGETAEQILKKYHADWQPKNSSKQTTTVATPIPQSIPVTQKRKIGGLISEPSYCTEFGTFHSAGISKISSLLGANSNKNPLPSSPEQDSSTNYVNTDNTSTTTANTMPITTSTTSGVSETSTSNFQSTTSLVFSTLDCCPQTALSSTIELEPTVFDLIPSLEKGLVSSPPKSPTLEDFDTWFNESQLRFPR